MARASRRLGHCVCNRCLPIEADVTREVALLQADVCGMRRILAAFLGLGEGDDFDVGLLDRMTPELVLRLDMIAAELLELGRTEEAVRTLRGAVLRALN